MAGREDWYRNESWSEEIEKQFDEKLKRARTQGPQYLCIQAITLAKLEPRVALRLLERYFATGDKFDVARSLQAQAQALEALGLVGDAVESYKKALEREDAHPGVITGTHLELPHLIATRRLRLHYDLAMGLLLSPYYEPRQHGRVGPSYMLVFPAQVFMHAWSLAVIYDDRGDKVRAVKQAQRALKAAAVTDSPLPRHPGLGLVKNQFEHDVEIARTIVDPGWKGTLKKTLRRLATGGG